MPIRIEGKNPKVTFEAARILLPETARRATDAAARAMEKVILAGAPQRLSGVGTNGARLSVRRIQSGSATQPQTVVKAIGPWQLIEGDTKPHVILSKSFGSRRRRQQIAAGLATRAAGRRLSAGSRTRGDAFIGAQHAGAVLTPRGPRVYARHPGTKGKHVWERGVDRGTPAATLAFAQAVRADLRRQFG